MLREEVPIRRSGSHGALPPRHPQRAPSPSPASIHVLPLHVCDPAPPSHAPVPSSTRSLSALPRKQRPN
jgi:hypothetical protein